MPSVRPHTDLDQLRRQARELLRAARAGDADALARLDAIAVAPTLAGAQLALAREQGFSSWSKLKADVDRQAAARLEPSSPRGPFVLRRARTPNELRALWRTVHALVGVDEPEEWRWLRELERYRERPHEFLVVEQDGRIVAGALSLGLLAVDSSVRHLGLGRRLLQTVEAEQIASGAESLSTHVGHDPRGFLIAMGYVERARSKQFVYKGAPSPRLAERRIARWREKAGDLDAGVLLEIDPTTGQVPSLPW